MALERPARLFIDVNNFPIGITWEVNANVDFYFCHFVINLCLPSSLSAVRFTRFRIYLFLKFWLLDIGLQLSGD